MKEVLIYGNRKMDDEVWDISTQELREKAFLELFAMLRDDWQVYSAAALNKVQQTLYNKASAGDAAAAEKLLKFRQSYEYESWHTKEVR